jgi:hypothetical protein
MPPAVALAGAAAWFSIRGMVVIFPGSPVRVVIMAIAMECAKLVTAGWLARRWSTTAVIWRAALVVFVFGLAVINATGVYAQLVAPHVGERGAPTSHLEERTVDLEARIDVQAHKVADLDRRLGQIDSAIEEAAKRSRTKTALSAMDDQRKARGALVDERKREAGARAILQTERASVAAKGRQAETEAAPIRYVAEPRARHRFRGCHRLADRADGADLRPSRDRIDGRGVGLAINYDLKPRWSAVHSITALPTRSRAHSG